MVFQALKQEEYWNIIPLEALLNYGVGYPSSHDWFGEFENGRLIGIIYHHAQLLHFIYDKPPQPTSPLYRFITNHYPRFVTHGKKELIEPLLANLIQSKVVLQDQSVLYLQSSATEEKMMRIKADLPDLTMRIGSHRDYTALLAMYHNTEVHSEIDVPLISNLLKQKRIIVAEKNDQLIGSAMILKEGLAYSLLGGLFVLEKERSQGIATSLGIYIIEEVLKKNKRVCFYFNDPALKEFYQRGAFIEVGEWLSYSVTSNEIIC